MENTKNIIIEKIVDFYSKENEEEGNLYSLLSPEKYKAIKPFFAKILQENTRIELDFDMKNHFQEIDFQYFKKENTTKEYRFVKQGGGDLYSYIKLKIQSISEPLLRISEELPDFFEVYEGTVAKNKCIELTEVYPYIIKALLDYCIKEKVFGILFTLVAIRFHPVDYRPYAYYICTKKLLEEL